MAITDDSSRIWPPKWWIFPLRHKEMGIPMSGVLESGLPGLLPKRPGPRRGHKLSEAVVSELESASTAQPDLSSRDLARLVEERFGMTVHPRSVERALARRRKGGSPERS